MLSASDNPNPSMVKNLLHASNPVSLQAPAASPRLIKPPGNAMSPSSAPIAPIVDQQREFLRSLQTKKGAKPFPSPASHAVVPAGGSSAAGGGPAQSADFPAAAAPPGAPANYAQGAPGDRAKNRAAAKAHEKKMRNEAAAAAPSAAIPDPLVAQYAAVFEVGGDDHHQRGRIVKVRRGGGRGDGIGINIRRRTFRDRFGAEWRVAREQ